MCPSSWCGCSTLEELQVRGIIAIFPGVPVTTPLLHVTVLALSNSIQWPIRCELARQEEIILVSVRLRHSLLCSGLTGFSTMNGACSNFWAQAWFQVISSSQDTILCLELVEETMGHGNCDCADTVKLTLFSLVQVATFFLFLKQEIAELVGVVPAY